MSTSTGRLAEDAAADYLKREGYKILERNWRTRWCEIDIVASKNGVVYFVEVKYRADSHWGSGLEYITQKKLQQMRFAAEFWIASNSTNCDFRLAAVALAGDPPVVADWLNDLS